LDLKFFFIEMDIRGLELLANWQASKMKFSRALVGNLDREERKSYAGYRELIGGKEAGMRIMEHEYRCIVDQYNKEIQRETEYFQKTKVELIEMYNAVSVLQERAA
jgi:hypothetical protein